MSDEIYKNPEKWKQNIERLVNILERFVPDNTLISDDDLVWWTFEGYQCFGGYKPMRRK